MNDNVRFIHVQHGGECRQHRRAELAAGMNMALAVNNLDKCVHGLQRTVHRGTGSIRCTERIRRRRLCRGDVAFVNEACTDAFVGNQPCAFGENVLLTNIRRGPRLPIDGNSCSRLHSARKIICDYDRPTHQQAARVS